MAFYKSVKNICTKRVIIPTVLWFAYLSLGAFMFSRIERPKEMDFENNEKEWLRELIKQVINTTNNATDLQGLLLSEDGDNLTIIEDFIDEVVDHYHPEKRNYKWDMEGGIHFCLTVVSTIGYGILVPRTQTGRAVCVIYAIIGIPLNIIFMAGIGRVIARLIDHTYCLCLKALRLCLCYKSEQKSDQSKERHTVKPLQRHNAWSDKVRREGAAEPDPDTAKDQKQCEIKETYGKMTRSSVFHVTYSDWSKQRETSFMGSTLHEDRVANRMSEEAKSCDDGDKANAPDFEGSVDNPTDSPKPLAPVWFVICFVATITNVCVLILWFSDILEDNWTLIDLYYFEFITFSTIGFGDLYINPPTKKASRHISVFVDVIVIVFGMSLVSTVLNVITSSNRLDQALEFAACLLQTVKQYICNIFRRDRT